MKTLNEYCKANLINEYLSTKAKVYNGFPKNPDPNVIVEFLTSRGFEEIKKSESNFYVENGKKIYNAKGRVFIKGSYSPDNRWSQSIMFGDTSEPSKEVRIFFVRTNEELIQQKVESCFMYWDFTKAPEKMGEQTNKLYSYEKFVETINEYYKW